MSIPGQMMEIGGYNYHVCDVGEGDKVAMLVHGMPDNGSCWKYQIPALVLAGYRVIVPDTLGYGRTDRPLEIEAYTMEKVIGHMFEIIQGGHWGMLDHPDDVNKLMLEWFDAPASNARADVQEG